MGILNKDNYPNHGKFDGSLMGFLRDLMCFLLFLVCQCLLARSDLNGLLRVGKPQLLALLNWCEESTTN